MTAWRKARLDRQPTGQPAKVELRDVFNAILYLNRTGIPWKYVPHDFPSHDTIYAYYAAWRDEGIFTQLNYDLTTPAHAKEGRKPEPTASAIDIQSIKTSTNVPVNSQATDAAKGIAGRKRGITANTIGPILAVTVTAASLSENALGIRLLNQAKSTYPTIAKSWSDTGSKKAVLEHGAKPGNDVEVVNRNPRVRVFHVEKRRWAVERNIGWIMMHRRLARDYETLATSPEAMIHIASTYNLPKCITDETTPIWRGTYQSYSSPSPPRPTPWPSASAPRTRSENSAPGESRNRPTADRFRNHPHRLQPSSAHSCHTSYSHAVVTPQHRQTLTTGSP